MAQYQRIFAALDGASTQKAVAQRAVALAVDNGAQLLFGHVIDSVPNEANGADYDALLKAAADTDFTSMRDNCRALVLSGETTAAEAARAIHSTID